MFEVFFSLVIFVDTKKPAEAGFQGSGVCDYEFTLFREASDDPESDSGD